MRKRCLDCLIWARRALAEAKGTAPPVDFNGERTSTVMQADYKSSLTGIPPGFWLEGPQERYFAQKGEA